MLKKEVQAKKVAKFMLKEVVGDSNDNAFKEDAIKGLEKAFMLGYDYCVQLCKEDNSNPGFAMAEFLELVEEGDE